MVCHCHECQKLSATSISITTTLKSEDLTLLSGELKVYTRVADSGNRNNCYFCPQCGNRIYHQNPEKSEMLRLKPGTLDNTDMIKPTMHLWLQSKQSWVTVDPQSKQYQIQAEL
jgi:hypothetical protein